MLPVCYFQHFPSRGSATGRIIAYWQKRYTHARTHTLTPVPSSCGFSRAVYWPFKWSMWKQNHQLGWQTVWWRWMKKLAITFSVSAETEHISFHLRCFSSETQQKKVAILTERLKINVQSSSDHLLQAEFVKNTFNKTWLQKWSIGILI